MNNTLKEMYHDLKKDLKLTREVTLKSNGTASKLNGSYNSMKKCWFLIALLVFIIIVVGVVYSVNFLGVNIKHFSLTMENVKLEMDKGVQEIEDGLEELHTQIEMGKGHRITLKQNAFSVIDDTESTFDGALNNMDLS